MQIKYLDLQTQYQSLKPEIDNAIQQVINHTAFTLGKAVDEFEKAFASYCQVKCCAGVNSGTNALLLALKALDVGPDDEVITAANTFIATVAAIVHSGAKPVLVDIDPISRNIDPLLLSIAISRKTKVIIPVHLYGRIADMDPIVKIAEKYNISILEDAAQAHGAEYKGKRAGSMGRMAAFSFYPGKNLGAYGEGGAVVTSDSKLDQKVRMLRDHGSAKKYYHDIVGYNARMEGIQGAVLGVKLKYLDKWNQERNRVTKSYNKFLEGLPIRLPEINNDYYQVFHLYVIETDQRDELQNYLKNEGITTLIHYPIPNHLQKALDYLGYKEGDFPVTEKLAKEILSLPIYPELTEEQIKYIADKIRNFFE
ncbi:MAG: DegT/DnrJ/EryC1/StrS family aminotransferase [FCB group bacterium]|nr:DegT/DnrJ/EryC1/StrS family aminotransferase [FCB group bacterium]